MILFRIILFFLLVLQFPNVFGQLKSKVNTSIYRFDKKIIQHKCTLKFWKGSTDSTRFDVLLERISQANDTLIRMEPGFNGVYYLNDKNNDGFKDFVTNYHGYDIIYLFNNNTNLFQNDSIHLPEETGLIDTARKIYWSYREAQYQDHQSFSILYQYKGLSVVELYKIVFVSKEGYPADEDIIRIDLYKMVKKDKYAPVFFRTINTNNPRRFNYKKYWETHYRRLIGYR